MYGACAGLGPSQLAPIAAQAGVHLYGDPPIQVLASERIVCVHVARGGSYRLRLPPLIPWRDVFTGRTIEKEQFDFPEAGVALFVPND